VGVTVVTSDWHIPRARLAFDNVFKGSNIPLAYSAAVSSSLSRESRRGVEIREASGRQHMLTQLEEHFKRIAHSEMQRL